MIREKITNFLATSSFSPKMSRFLTGLVQAILKSNPNETLKSLLPQTCERIERLLQQLDLTDHKGDAELTWCLNLFSELVRTRGDLLMNYKSMILSTFHRCIHVVHKGSYEAIGKAAKYLLKSLSYVYPIDYRLTVENVEAPFTDFLPIRVGDDVTRIPSNLSLSSRHGVNRWHTINCKFNSIFPMLKKWISPVTLSRRFSILNCNCSMKTA